MDIQWPSYDDDDGPCFDDDDPGDLYQFTPDEIHTTTQRPLNDHVTKCGIVVQVETDPRRVQYLEQALIDGLSSGPSLCSKDSPPSSFRVLPGKGDETDSWCGCVVFCPSWRTEQPEKPI
jgi:hypothetical protein